MLTLTPAAAAQIHAAAATATLPGGEAMGLRIAAHYDAAADETHYGFGFDDQREHDEAFEIAGITVFVSPLSRAAVVGLTVDFVELEPGDFRFIFYRADDRTDAAPTPPSCGGGDCGGGSGSR